MERNTGDENPRKAGRGLRAGSAGGLKSALCAIVNRLAFLTVPLITGTALAQVNHFPADAVVDVTLAPYKARPDDNQDDTAAIQSAISDCVGTGRPVFFPNGIYDVSDSLLAKNKSGKWEAHLTLQGSSRSTIRLKNQCTGFVDPTKPRAVIVMASHWEPGDADDGGGNKAFRNNVFDLTIDTGTGNSGAIGIDYAASNWGAIERVHIQSRDYAGVTGVALRRNIPGPGLINGLQVDGFAVGLDVHDIQYGMTVRRFHAEHAKIAHIRTDQNVLSVDRLAWNDEVPLLLGTGRGALLNLRSARLSTPNKGASIDWKGSLNIVDVSLFGEASIIAGGKTTAAKKILNFTWPPAMGGAFAPIEDLYAAKTGGMPHSAPDTVEGNPANWRPVGPRLAGETDDTGAIQRAIDATNAIVYFPIGRTYFVSDTIDVRGNVRQIMGMGAEISLGAAKAPFSNVANPRPIFRINSTSADAVIFENCFFNVQYPGEVIFENNSPKPLVIRHCGGWVGSAGHRRSYRNTPTATGPVYIEDVFLPGWAFTKQQVWAWQFNPENPDGDGSEPQVLNDGGSLGIVGFKTEGPAPFIVTRNGGRTQLLGGYNYISATNAPAVPRAAVPYLVEDSEAALSFVADNFRDSDYDVYVRKTVGGKIVKEWKHSDLPPRNGNPGDRSVAVPLLVP